MMTGFNRYCFIAGITALGLSGCGGTETAAPPSQAEAPSTSAAPSEAVPAAKVVLAEDEKAEIAKLADKADQAAALAQATCPISGENLGSMGVPIKMTAEGKTVFICCNGCKKEFEKDPKAALAKLAK